MKRQKSLLLGGATLACALGIGYVMQYGLGLPGSGSVQMSEIALTGIENTSSAILAPVVPKEPIAKVTLPEPTVVLAAATQIAVDNVAPASVEEKTLDCSISVQADAKAGALVNLRVEAPCHAGERLTIHHYGLMFTEIMPANAPLSLSVPAMTSRASFIVAFASGSAGTAVADVETLPYYNRVAVQWKGNAGLQLHALEFGAEYFSDGHIWASSMGELTKAALGESGFLTRLGRNDVPGALLAEIYSFPVGTSTRTGDINLSVEAEISAENCGQSVEAQTLELREQDGLRTRDLTVDIPDCASIGDFLVLKNLIEDLTIASR